MKNSKSRGAATIEMALVLPLLMMLTFGVIEYGWIFLKLQQVTGAARHAARIGVTADATNGDISNAVTSLMSEAGLGASGYQVTISPGNTAGLAAGQPLNVTVAVPYENVELIGIPLIPVPPSLRASVTMAKEGS
jgi:Flp pilus assembly protein TadG